MSVAKVTEIIASSKSGFDDAVAKGIKRASKTLRNVTSAWVQSQQVVVEEGKITEYRVNLKVTFILGGLNRFSVKVRSRDVVGILVPGSGGLWASSSMQIRQQPTEIPSQAGQIHRLRGFACNLRSSGSFTGNAGGGQPGLRDHEVLGTNGVLVPFLGIGDSSRLA